MSWEEVKEIMLNKGYQTTGILKNESSNEILSIQFIKSIPIEYEFPINISAQVMTHNFSCESCWTIELRVAPLQMFMYISSGPLPFWKVDLDKVEKVISLYGKHNRNFNPLENLT